MECLSEASYGGAKLILADLRQELFVFLVTPGYCSSLPWKALPDNRISPLQVLFTDFTEWEHREMIVVQNGVQMLLQRWLVDPLPMSKCGTAKSKIDGFLQPSRMTRRQLLPEKIEQGYSEYPSKAQGHA